MSPNIVATAKANRSIVSVVRFTIILILDGGARVYFDWFAASGDRNEGAGRTGSEIPDIYRHLFLIDSSTRPFGLARNDEKCNWYPVSPEIWPRQAGFTQE